MMPGCPKAMVHGPCGGVRDDGRCEIGAFPCSFVDPVSLAATRPVKQARFTPAAPLLAAGAELLTRLERGEFVLADLPSRPLDAESQRAAAAAVAGHVDAVLLGDAPWARVQLPPSVRARIVAEEGVTPWPGLTCRDRNAAALKGELEGLAALGVPAVHCVTGDHPVLGHRPDDEAVFALDSPRLAALAAQAGLLVSVAEAPAAPPIAERPARVALKASMGASVCFVNLAAGHEAVAEFVAASRALAPELHFIVCVPLATSSSSLERLGAFARQGFPDGTVAALEAPDPVGAAVRCAVAQAERMLAIDGVSGVDIAAAAAPGEELAVAAALALAGSALGAGS